MFSKNYKSLKSLKMKKSIKILSSVLLLFLISFYTKAQDTIILKTNEKVIATISEINEMKIRYKEFSNPSGPEYVINKNIVYKIIFKNGDTKIISDIHLRKKYGRNIFAYHVFYIIYKDFTLSYEHIFKSGKVGLKIPVAIGYNTKEGRDGPREYSNLFYSGVGLNIYLMGQRMASYFIGPEIHLGQGQEMYYVHDNSDYTSSKHFDKFFYWRLVINNGISFSPITNFRLAAVLGLGVRNYKIPESKDDNNDGGFKSTAYVTISMGYRF